MNLHLYNEEFTQLISLTARKVKIPEGAVRKDYLITWILNNLVKSEHYDHVVFKGGTSLSKCYPGSIDRFSEDIDLTYVPEEGMSNKQINRKLKAIERVLIDNAEYEIIGEERNDRNKSCYVWLSEDSKALEQIKLEIGSSVRPHPYHRKVFRPKLQ